jgi:hypothetical protein
MESNFNGFEDARMSLTVAADGLRTFFGFVQSDR